MALRNFGTDKKPAWGVDFVYRGKRERYVFKGRAKEVKTLAKQEWARIEFETSQNKYDPRQLREETLKKIFEIYREEKVSCSKSEAEGSANVRKIISHWGGFRLSDIDEKPQLVNEFFEKGIKEKLPGLKDGSYKNYFIRFRAGLNHYIKTRRLHVINPCDVVSKRYREDVRTNVPTEDDFDQLIHFAKTTRTKTGDLKYPPHLAVLLTQLWETGRRVGEVLQYEWQNLDDSLNPQKRVYPSILVPRLKQGREYWERILIPRRALKALMSLPGPKEHGKVFPWTSRPTRMISSLLKDSGMKGLWLHDFRRAKNLSLSDDYGIEKARRALGQQSDSINRRYAPFDARNMADTVADSYAQNLPNTANSDNETNREWE
jgi:integrase